MRINRSSSPRFAWAREGDHQAEAERIIARNTREHGGQCTGEPSVMVRSAPGGRFTILSATGYWWLEYMVVHDSWGAPTRDDDDLLAPLVDMKTEG
ncbi:hypothetical protein [Gemmatimonas sp.]|uniref:hypothetical protein n=1 Tax=Gemmatimonas sp. TaxID=1962908 RepID=UPI003983717B